MRTGQHLRIFGLMYVLRFSRAVGLHASPQRFPHLTSPERPPLSPVTANKPKPHAVDGSGLVNTSEVRYSDQGTAYVFQGGVFRAVDEDGTPTDRFQIPGVVCRDCHHYWNRPCIRPSCKPVCVRKRTIEWCDGERHYTFIGQASV
jgi:hypothetical protein